MPTFMGIHERLPRGATAAEVAEVHPGDPRMLPGHGVRFLRCWIDDQAGKVFCLAEAPSAESVAAAHAQARRAPLDRVYQVQEVEGPGSSDHRAPFT